MRLALLRALLCARRANTWSNRPFTPRLLPQFTGEWLNLEAWYTDPKKRERSHAVKISKYLKARAAGIAC